MDFLCSRNISVSKSHHQKQIEDCMREDCMRESVIKLALWYTRTFKPIMTHDELEPIMATLGFVASPCFLREGGAWKEYLYSAPRCRSQSLSEPPPRPRLPYPRIDGIHIYTYRAFLDAVNFYLDMGDNISDLFHIRGMPLNRVHDRSKKWHGMEANDSDRGVEEDDSDRVCVYREGTMDQAIYKIYQSQKNEMKSSSSSSKACNPITVRSKGNKTPPSCVVSLKDIIVSL